MTNFEKLRAAFEPIDRVWDRISHPRHRTVILARRSAEPGRISVAVTVNRALVAGMWSQLTPEPMPQLIADVAGISRAIFLDITAVIQGNPIRFYQESSMNSLSIQDHMEKWPGIPPEDWHRVIYTGWVLDSQGQLDYYKYYLSDPDNGSLVNHHFRDGQSLGDLLEARAPQISPEDLEAFGLGSCGIDTGAGPITLIRRLDGSAEYLTIWDELPQ